MDHGADGFRVWRGKGYGQAKGQVFLVFVGCANHVAAVLREFAVSYEFFWAGVDVCVDMKFREIVAYDLGYGAGVDVDDKGGPDGICRVIPKSPVNKDLVETNHPAAFFIRSFFSLTADFMLASSAFFISDAISSAISRSLSTPRSTRSN